MIKAKTLEKTTTSSITGAVGRRKSSVARAWIRRGNGGVAVNQKRCSDYFDTQETRSQAVKSLTLCNVVEKYDVIVNVQGGGKNAQADAVNLAIARALVKDNESFKEALREAGSLTVDSRNKERKKPGQKAARRKFQFVKR